jgi:hypothetical protein
MVDAHHHGSRRGVGHFPEDKITWPDLDGVGSRREIRRHTCANDAEAPGGAEDSSKVLAAERGSASRGADGPAHGSGLRFRSRPND